MPINPWDLYLINVFDSLELASLCLAVVFITGSVIFGYSCLENMESKDAQPLKKLLIICIVAALINIMITVLIPSKDTMVMMEAVKITSDGNVSATLDNLKSAIDYAADAIK